jgi:transcriptional regulator with XRE-family HTH domain
MGRNLNQIIADLPADRQARIDARYREMKDEVEGLRELRQVAGKAQADIATALNIKQPSVSKIEKQADMYLSTLRNYVHAIGGELELVVRLRSRQAIRLQRFGDVVGTAVTPPQAVRRKAASGSSRRTHRRPKVLTGTRTARLCGCR